MKRVLVTGSRDWRDKETIQSALVHELGNAAELLVIHGDCPTGADALAEQVCREEGIHTARVAARWDIHGKAAGPIRNSVMIAMEPQIVLVFHDDLANSKGTKDCHVKAVGVGWIDVRQYQQQPKFRRESQ